jgi:transcriptional regulator with XRE-family HTH domain
MSARARMRRMMLGMSQEKLGDALGLTFQQVRNTKGREPNWCEPAAADW